MMACENTEEQKTKSPFSNLDTVKTKAANTEEQKEEPRDGSQVKSPFSGIK